MSLTYNIALQKAVENGVYVIGACGFDSIPADLGQICVRREMGNFKIVCSKGSSINYVITFGGLGRPPPPYVIL